MSTFLVQVKGSGSTSWYRHYIGETFQVRDVGKQHNFDVVNTPHNQAIGMGESLVARMEGRGSFGVGLGIKREHCIRLDITSNRAAASLLSQE